MTAGVFPQQGDVYATARPFMGLPTGRLIQVVDLAFDEPLKPARIIAFRPISILRKKIIVQDELMVHKINGFISATVFLFRMERP